MAKSGTVTLELALADVPMVVAYRVSPATAFVVRRLVSVKHASLVNLLNEHEVVPEFLQENCTPERLAAGVEALLSSDEVRKAQLQGFRQLAKALGEGWPRSESAARRRSPNPKRAGRQSGARHHRQAQALGRRLPCTARPRKAGARAHDAQMLLDALVDHAGDAQRL